MTFTIVPERPEDAALIGPLLDRTFGFDRTAKTVYRLRQPEAAVPALSFAAVSSDGSLFGSLRFWRVTVGREHRIVLLGPLAVEPALQGIGIGRSLVRHGLAAARTRGERICLVVGDPAYYRPFGFTSAGAAGFILPGPVEPERFQVLELVAGALAAASGLIHRYEAPQEERRGRTSAA
jgi:predicted N-acetyltransferase YhbS